MTIEVGFYQLTGGSVDSVLPRLLARIVGQGLRAVVRSEDAALLKLLDERLWTFDPDSFLPHGLAGAADEAQQPILLGGGEGAPGNGAGICVMLGAGLPADADRFARVLLMFSGADEAALAGARAAWRSLKDRPGFTRSYYTQTEAGGWSKQQ